MNPEIEILVTQKLLGTSVRTQLPSVVISEIFLVIVDMENPVIATQVAYG